MVLLFGDLIKQATLHCQVWTSQDSLKVAGNVFDVIILCHVHVTLGWVRLAHKLHVWKPGNVFVRRHVVSHAILDADDIRFRHINRLAMVIDLLGNICKLLLDVNYIKESGRRARFEINGLNYSQIVFNQELHLIQLDLVLMPFFKLIGHVPVMFLQFILSLYLKSRWGIRIIFELRILEVFVFDFCEVRFNMVIKMLLKHEWFVKYSLFDCQIILWRDDEYLVLVLRV